MARSVTFSKVPTQLDDEIQIDTHRVNTSFRSKNPRHRISMQEISMEELYELVVDPVIQRNLVDTEVNDIVRKFNPAALGVLTVSLRDNGVRSVVDGQQRRAALIRLHSEGAYDSKVQVMVHEGLSLAEEAQLFLDLNARRTVDAIRRFKTRLIAEDPQALDIERMLKELKILLGSQGVQAIETLDRIYSQPNGPDRLWWVLSTIKEVYDTSGRGGCYDGRVVMAFSMVHAAFIDILDYERLLDALSKVGNRISKLHGAGATKKEFNRGNLSYNMAEVIRLWYNDTRRRTTKLPAKLPEFPRRTLEALLEEGKEKVTEDRKQLASEMVRAADMDEDTDE